MPEKSENPEFETAAVVGAFDVGCIINDLNTFSGLLLLFLAFAWSKCCSIFPLTLKKKSPQTPSPLQPQQASEGCDVDVFFLAESGSCKFSICQVVKIKIVTFYKSTT